MYHHGPASESLLTTMPTSHGTKHSLTLVTAKLQTPSSSGALPHNQVANSPAKPKHYHCTMSVSVPPQVTSVLHIYARQG